ncbi:unnamed protein product, partial [Rotaria sp. Silwood1]
MRKSSDMDKKQTETEEETIPSDTKMKAKQAVMPFAAPKKLARN